MKIWFQCLLFALCVSFSATAMAAEASDEYVSIYSLITKGDEMFESGLQGEAAQFYSDAHRKLVAFRSAYPRWNEQVVRFRLKYLGERLADLPEIVADPVEGNPSVSAITPSPSDSAADKNRILEGQVAALNEQMRQLTADNSLLLSKLREAMSARPAAVDPSQVRKAEAKILELEKENELIELQLRRALEPKDPPQASLAQAAVDEGSQQRIEQLQTEIDALRSQVTAQGLEIQQSRDSQAALNQRLGAVTVERDALKAQVGGATGEAAANQAAANQVAQLTQANTELRQETEQLRQRIEGMMASEDNRDSIESLMRENAKLRREVTEASKESPVVEDADEALAKEIKSLKKQNRDLTSQLAKARRAADREKGSWLPRIGRRNSRNTSVLEARLAVLEAEKEPFNAQELALLKGADLGNLELDETAGAASATEEKAQISQAAATLEAQAQGAARSGEFSVAEAKYDEILDLIPNHAPTLASLALTQIKQGKLGEAEANLEMAREIAPENTYALFLSGLLKMGQERYDDAVTFLSRATVLDPDDAEAQNHLGVALTEVGHRDPAEAALRKAIRLRPGYGEAHVNLAVVYASQDPPFKELAKYHYQQAINSGHPADPRIEQLIGTK